MIFCIALRLLSLLYMRNVSKFKGKPLFLFTLPCFAPYPTHRFGLDISPMIYSHWRSLQLILVAKQIAKKKTLRDACYFMTFMLDEREARSQVITASLHLSTRPLSFASLLGLQHLDGAMMNTMWNMYNNLLSFLISFCSKISSTTSSFECQASKLQFCGSHANRLSKYLGLFLVQYYCSLDISL